MSASPSRMATKDRLAAIRAKIANRSAPGTPRSASPVGPIPPDFTLGGSTQNAALSATHSFSPKDDSADGDDSPRAGSPASRGRTIPVSERLARKRLARNGDGSFARTISGSSSRPPLPPSEPDSQPDAEKPTQSPNSSTMIPTILVNDVELEKKKRAALVEEVEKQMEEERKRMK